MKYWTIGLLIAVVAAVMNYVGPDLDGHECFEDEAVVLVLQEWDASNQHVNVTHYAACAAVDDLRSLD